MATFRLDRWLPTIVMSTVILVFVVANIAIGEVAAGLVTLVSFAAVLWWSWPGPARGPHISHREAMAGATDDDLIIYWRPG